MSFPCMCPSLFTDFIRIYTPREAANGSPKGRLCVVVAASTTGWTTTCGRSSTRQRSSTTRGSGEAGRCAPKSTDLTAQSAKAVTGAGKQVLVSSFPCNLTPRTTRFSFKCKLANSPSGFMLIPKTEAAEDPLVLRALFSNSALLFDDLRDVLSVSRTTMGLQRRCSAIFVTWHTYFGQYDVCIFPIARAYSQIMPCCRIMVMSRANITCLQGCFRRSFIDPASVYLCRQKTIEEKMQCGDCKSAWCGSCLANRYGCQGIRIRLKYASCVRPLDLPPSLRGTPLPPLSAEPQHVEQ